MDWQTVAHSAVAQFRLATAAMTDDPALTSLVSLLMASSDESARHWSNREIADPPIWRKTLRHPAVGDMRLDFALLQPRGRDSNFFVSIYTPGDETSRDSLERLLASDAVPTRPRKAPDRGVDDTPGHALLVWALSTHNNTLAPYVLRLA